MKRTIEGEKSIYARFKSNKGEVGLKQIAIAIGAIVIIGAVVTYVSKESTFSVWINEIWTYAFGKIKEIT